MDDVSTLVANISKRVDHELDITKYVCYKMLVECKDPKLAKEFIKVCNGTK